MSNKAKQPAKAPKTPEKTAPRRPVRLRWALLLLIAAAAAAALWRFWPKAEKVGGYKPDELHGSEQTLTAKSPLLQLLSPEETGIDFQNIITETPENNITTNINIYNGGGVAIADVNNDGLPDVYFVCSNGKNRLYLNQGGMKFKDISDQAGVGSEEGFETAACAADVNSDGWIDLYVCHGGPFDEESRRNKLYINNGSPNAEGVVTFTERSKEYGLHDISASSGAAFFDGDGDGDLDCYVLNYPTDIGYASKIDVVLDKDGKPVPNLVPKKPSDTDRYYRNDGPPALLAGQKGGFADVSKESGIWNMAFGLSVSVSDFNRDGHPDVYVGNDFFQPDKLYINSGKGTFTDRIADMFRHSSQSTMGTDISDFDNDGQVDLFGMDMFPKTNRRKKLLETTNTVSKYLSMVQNNYFEPVTHNVLQRNNGNGTFSDIACLAGIFDTDWSWSCLAADFDNDSYRDLFITNGYRRDVGHRDYNEFILPDVSNRAARASNDPYQRIQIILNTIPSYKLRNFIFQNTGDWRFKDMGGEWATLNGTWSCGAAWADLDGDGDLDLVVSNLEQPSQIYKNLCREENRGNYLQAKLKGSPQNAFAVGASVLIEYAGGLKQYQEISPNRGIFSCSEHLIHFGMGKHSQVEKLTVRWPDGKTQTLENVPVNQRLQLKWEDASGYVKHLVPFHEGPALMQEVSAASGVRFVHEENKYVDFEQFPLLPWSVSDLGPLLAAGDVNGDGLDDFYVGNSFEKPGALFVQAPDGKFKRMSDPMWEMDQQYEDHGALFFDFEGDGDMDLFVISGGAEAVSEAAEVAWQPRLYVNMDGKGTFGRANPAAIPDVRTVGLRAAAYDYDGDGDQDLFIGGRVTPKKWPLTPPSFVFRNDRNRLTDVTAQVGGDFAQCGMVTDLAWADLDKDGKPELVVVGEWMPVSVFSFAGGRLVNVTERFGLGKTNGIWHSLATADLDGDGDLDLVTGNLGLNTRFRTSPDVPMNCYAYDFDKNGTLDPIVSLPEGKKTHPMVNKAVMVKQIPSLKKKFLYAKDYAAASVEEMFPKEALEPALKLYAYELETCWWENQNGKFVRRSLPVPAQASTIQGIVATDANGDGHIDLLLVGNKYQMEVEGGRCDAGNGVFLTGDGKGNFRWVDNLQTGFWANREARDLKMLRGPGERKMFVVANNDSGVQVFRPY